MVYKFFDKKSKGCGIVNNNNNNNNENNNNKQNIQLADKLHKPILRKIKKKKSVIVLGIIFGCRFS